ncbi:MAG: cell division protein FtsH [Gemmatimonadetes bacterium]|nr:cell division protein FtsH [Gemmatimonadota bacterium]
MDKKTQLSLAYVVLFVLLVLYVQNSFVSPVQELDYGQFREWVEVGKVQECTITGETIRGVSDEGPFITVRVDPDPGLIEFLRKYGVSFKGEKEHWLTSLLGWLLPILIFFGIWMFMARRMGGGSGGLMSIGKSKAKVYMEKGTGLTFNDVAGIDEAKEELKEVVEFLQTPARFQALGGRIPRGVLLVGPPGTGKTLLAKAVAGEAEVPFFSISGSDFVEMFVGVGAARVRDLFEQAKKHAPAIIFIDELDALGKARGAGSFGGHDEREQTLNQLLTELDGFDTNGGVILMAATNRPEILDPALLRPGRFDRTVTVDRPDVKGREAILNIHAKDAKLAESVSLQKLAVRTPGFAGADLANVINEAALLAARRNKSAITMEELDEAVERTMAGLERKSRVLSEGERRVVAYHEAGHAIVGEVLPHANPVQKISIVSRGAALGYVLHMPTEDRYLKSKDEILDEICMALGGRVAEEIVFEGVTSGAANDLQRATQLAERMVKEFGMSERLGLVSHKEERNQQFLGMGANDRQYSEETAREIDKEIARIMQESKDRAREVLNERRNILDDLVEILFKNEVMDGDELRDLLNRTNGEAEVGKEGAEEAEGKDLNNSSAEAPQEVN